MLAQEYEGKEVRHGPCPSGIEANRSGLMNQIYQINTDAISTMGVNGRELNMEDLKRKEKSAV